MARGLRPLSALRKGAPREDGSPARAEGQLGRAVLSREQEDPR